MKASTVTAAVIWIVANTSTAAASTFTGTVDTSWNNPANWSAGVPSGAEGAIIPAGRTVDVTQTPPTFNADFDIQNSIVNIAGEGVVLTFGSNGWWGRDRQGNPQINIRDGARLFQPSGNAHFGTAEGSVTTMTLDNGTFENLDQIKNGGVASRMYIVMSNGSSILGKHFWVRHEHSNQHGYLRGSGTISVTDSFKNNGRVEAQGGDLVFESFGAGLWDDNGWPIRMVDGQRAGWYASAEGRLVLPTLEVTGTTSWGDHRDDDTLDIANSLRLVEPDADGTVDISLLAPDAPDVLPGLVTPIGIWAIDPGGDLRAASLEFRYDDDAAGDLAGVKLLYNAGDGWIDVSGSNSGRIIASAGRRALAGQFAVAEDAENLIDDGTAEFRRGDADGDGSVSLTDAVRILNHLFQGGEPPDCLDASDADNDNDVLLTDAVFVLAFLFQQGPPPASPGPDTCGEDPDGDAPDETLGCGLYSTCE